MPSLQQDLREDVVPNRVRKLALLAAIACIAMGTLSFGPIFPVYGGFLLVGIVVQPKATTTGRWLMWIGALLLSQATLQYGLGLVLSGAKLLRSIHDAGIIMMYTLAVLSVILVLWCDAALVIEGLKSWGKSWATSNLDWIAWIAAVTLTTWLVWNTSSFMYSHQHSGRADILLSTGLLGAGTLCFDLLLVLHAIMRRRLV